MVTFVGSSTRNTDEEEEEGSGAGNGDIQPSMNSTNQFKLITYYLFTFSHYIIIIYIFYMPHT